MLRRATRIGFLALGIQILLSGVPGLAESAFEEALEKAIEEAAGTASDNDEEESPPPARPAPAPSGPLSKLSVHGFLTQAWADADFTDVPVGPLPPPRIGVGPLGPSPDLVEETLGIPEDGTTNYRDLALQFRYDMSDKDVFVVQFSSRTIGDSPLQVLSDDIELDWAFYERRLADHTSLKVGRVQIPLGIYNELRDVGTVLPLYRPSNLFYGEGTFTSETVDGVALSHTFFPDHAWNLDVSVYAGGWEAINYVPGLVEPEIVDAKDGFGYQLWLNSPWDVRLGAGQVSFKQIGGGFLEPINGRRDIYHTSLDALFGRFTLQAEWKWEEGIQIDISLIGLPGDFSEFSVSEWYINAGFQVTEKLRIFAQAETAYFDGQLFPLDINSSARKQREDTAVALNYSFTPSIVLKGEYHWTVSRGANKFPDFSTGAFRLRNEVFKADGGSYSIVALAVSF